MLEFAESGCPIFRATSPLSRSRLQSHRSAQKPRTWQIVNTVALTWERLKLLFVLLSTIFTELKNTKLFTQNTATHRGRTIEFFIRAKRDQKDTNTHKPTLTTPRVGHVEIGQHFMTKDTAEFSQFRAAAFRECTLSRDEEASQPKGWIQSNTKFGHVLEVATCYQHGKCGVEIVSMDNSHSLVRISHGSNHEQEVQLEEHAAGSSTRTTPIGKRI